MISPTSLYGAQSPSLSGLGTSSLNPALSPTSALATSPSGLSQASSLPGGLTGAGDTGMSGMLQQLMSMMMTILSMIMPMLMQALGGGGQQPPAANDIGTFTPPAPGASSGGGGGGSNNIPPGLDNSSTQPPAGGAAPADSGQLVAGIKNKTADPAQRDRLNTTLGKIAQDPDGAKLLKAAEANGYTIEVGDPTQAGSQDNDADSVNGVTIPGQKRIVVSPNAPDFDKTVAHELVHAATESDGNSQTEEGMADVLGYRVSSRMDGKQEPGTEQQIFQNKIKSYPNLQGNNDIMNSLSKLGIQA